MTDTSLLLSKAIAWAEEHSLLIRENGEPLNPSEIAIAATAGVAHPESVRVLEVTAIPVPDDAELAQAAVSVGMFGPRMAGLTLGSGIYIVRSTKDERLLSHELRHVFQYEQAGSIAAFMGEYLKQLMSYGYAEAPLEIDAREHEQI